ncbi:unnamed protein product [Closterium sp. NIES-54]
MFKLTPPCPRTLCLQLRRPACALCTPTRPLPAHALPAPPVSSAPQTRCPPAACTRPAPWSRALHVLLARPRCYALLLLSFLQLLLLHALLLLLSAAAAAKRAAATAACSAAAATAACSAAAATAAPPSRPAATTAAAAARATAAAGGGAAGSAGSAAGAGGAGGATGSAGGAAGAGGAGPTTDRHCLSWPLLRQLQWLGVDSGGHCLSRTTPPLSSFASGFFSEPVQVVEALAFYVLHGGGSASESAAALGASESAAALSTSESAATLGASESAAAPDASESAAALGARASPATGPSSAEALHTFTLDSGASRCFFCDCTTLTPLAAPVPDVWVDTFIPGGQRVVICTSGGCVEVSASGQLAASCSCRVLSHQTLLWHHRLGHPSLPRLRSMHSRLLAAMDAEMASWKSTGTYVDAVPPPGANIETEGYRCFQPDPGIGTAALGACEAAALGVSASALSGTGETALSGTASSSSSLTFTLDSGASRSFFRDRTTLTPLGRPVAVSLADPSGGPVLSHFSTVLPCPAAPSGTLSGLYLPSFSTNLVSGADLQDVGVHQFTPASQRVTHCTEARTGRHLATFSRRPGSSLYTLTVESPPVPASGQVAESGQVLAVVSRSGPESAPCSCRLLSHETLLWHHRLGHPSLPRLRSMASRVLVSGLPQSLPPLPSGPGPSCVPCVEGRLRATPRSSHFPPTEAPLQTLHMDVWGPAPVRGQGYERYFLLVVDDYSRYTAVLPLRSKGAVTEVLIDWIREARLQLRKSFGSDFPVLRLHSDRG